MPRKSKRETVNEKFMEGKAIEGGRRVNDPDEVDIMGLRQWATDQKASTTHDCFLKREDVQERLRERSSVASSSSVQGGLAAKMQTPKKRKGDGDDLENSGAESNPSDSSQVQKGGGFHEHAQQDLHDLPP